MIYDLIEDLKRDEGWVPYAYKDHLGYWTIGHGFLIDQRKGGELPEAIGVQWLQHVAVNKWSELTQREPWILEQPEDVQRALGNMSYQMGVGGVLGFKRMLAALREGSREKAAEEALQSLWAEQTPDRAARVARLIRG